MEAVVIRRAKTLIVSTVALACATGATLADGYHAASKFERAKAYCEIAAGVSGDGDPTRRAEDVKHDYDLCMTLHGYAKDTPSLKRAP
jgi:hypothetical protein